MRKVLWAAFVACLLAGLVVVGTTTSASAAPVEKVVASGEMTTQANPWCCRLFKNQDTGLWLDDSFDFGLRTYQYNGSNFQKWQITDWADQTHEMRSVSTGRCIDDSVEYGLRAFDCNKSKYQSWYWHNWPDGTTEFKNQATGRCMDNYFALRATQCDTSTSQSWW
jgi:hypothetical protein